MCSKVEHDKLRESPAWETVAVIPYERTEPLMWTVEGETLELRNCPKCATTISRGVSDDTND